MTETISYDRRKIVGVYRDLEEIIVSLDRIGSHVAIENLPQMDADRVLCRFFQDWHVFTKFANARSVLGTPFSRKLGSDQMDELERECQDVQYWSAPGSESA